MRQCLYDRAKSALAKHAHRTYRIECLRFAADSDWHYRPCLTEISFIVIYFMQFECE